MIFRRGGQKTIDIAAMGVSRSPAFFFFFFFTGYARLVVSIFCVAEKVSKFQIFFGSQLHIRKVYTV